MNLPNYSEHGYALSQVLGTNTEGGRITYLGQDASGTSVVIKRFAFASENASWDSYKAHEREIQVLKELRHPRIPEYLDAFSTDDGFCLVQSLVDAPALSERMTFDADEVKHIAISVLEILVYLQDRLPPVIHRDIKPDNILVDGEGHAYLVDFGLASTAERDRTASTLAAGTPGFMPPEQMLGKKLTTASDLFALGATLIAMLSGRRSNEVNALLDATNQFDLSALPSSLSTAFVRWLGKMVKPIEAERFPNAKAALRSLSALEISASETDFSTEEDDDESSDFDEVFLIDDEEEPEQVNFYAEALPEVAEPEETSGIRPWIIVVVAACFVMPGVLIFISSKPPELGSPPKATQAAELQVAEVEKEAPAPEPAPEKTEICRDNQGTWTNKAIEHEKRAILRADRGCVLKITHSNLKGPSAVLTLQGDAELVIDNTALEALSGSAIVVQGRESKLTLQNVAVTSKDIAIDMERGTLHLENTTITAPMALRVGSQAVVYKDTGSTLEGTHDIQEGGWIYGLDAAQDAERDRAARFEMYNRKACENVFSCYKDNNYDGVIKVEVRTSVDAQGQAKTVKILPKKPKNKAIRSCIMDGSARNLPDYDAADGPGTLICTVDATLSGFMTSMRGSSSKFVLDKKK